LARNAGRSVLRSIDAPPAARLRTWVQMRCLPHAHGGHAFEFCRSAAIGTKRDFC
jgi:hypothetical protein